MTNKKCGNGGLEKTGVVRVRCPVCKKIGVTWESDHKQPRSRGGTNCHANRWAICKDCNREKGKMTLFEFLTHKKKGGEKNG